ncbi:MAG: carboxypeptidase-like regulatory domain-containing protein, partial [Leptospiraceae bacterium]|nr:carboxypeptidase-like regulatory domain-containing protein [Leptospiraceae bacterium]
MKPSPTTKGKLNKKLSWLIQAAGIFTLIIAANAVDAQAKGKKPPAATAAVAGPAGSVRGKILDSANGEPMIGVTAVIKDLGLFGVTDIDGNYVIANVPPGQHTVTYQITGYQSASTNVQVNSGKPARANITMNYKVSSEVVVTAKRVDNT